MLTQVSQDAYFEKESIVQCVNNDFLNGLDVSHFEQDRVISRAYPDLI